MVIATSAARATLITNGNFETGDFTGWTVASSFTQVEPSGTGGITAESGIYYAELGNVGCCGTISQTIADLPGETLQLSYYHISDGGVPNYFEADWNGVTIAGSIISDASDQRPDGWLHFVFDVTGTGSDSLTFLDQNNPADDGLDNVTLTALATPEPGTVAILGAGVLGLVSRRRRK